MASASDIDAVRKNTNEPTSENYSDETIGALVDAIGVAGASATIWHQKAAASAELVDVSEAGASHKLSDIHKNAVGMASHWQAIYDGETVAVSERLRIKRIERADA